MQQYLISVPETKHASFLLNYIIQTGYFNEVKPFIDDEGDEQQLLENDLAEAFYEVKLMKEGKLKKQTLREFINEL